MHILELAAGLVFLVVIVMGLLSYNSATNYNPVIPIIIPQCSVNPVGLLEIPSTQTHCYQNGKETNRYYIGTLDPTLDFVVAPYGTQPLDVCVGYCDTYNSGVCQGANFNGVSAQVNFNNCMTVLTPTQCNPPRPLAIQGSLIYYAVSPTAITCESPP